MCVVTSYGFLADEYFVTSNAELDKRNLRCQPIQRGLVVLAVADR